MKSAVSAYDTFRVATAAPLPGDVIWPDSPLASQLKMVAKTIAGRGGLGMCRMTFFVNYGGWDHHSGLLAGQQEMLPIVNDAVKAFYDTLAAIGAQDEVVLYSASDFGRSLTSNSQGSDHAWGGNQLVVGGQVKGRRIYGQYPDLFLDSSLDVGRGRLIPPPPALTPSSRKWPSGWASPPPVFPSSCPTSPASIAPPAARPPWDFCFKGIGSDPGLKER